MPRPRLRDCFKSGAVKGGDGKMGKFYDKRKVRQAKEADDAASGRHADTVEVPQEKEAGEAGQGGGMAAARNVRQMPSGLQMVDVRIGKGPPPEPGQNVFCKYQGGRPHIPLAFHCTRETPGSQPPRSPMYVLHTWVHSIRHLPRSPPCANPVQLRVCGSVE